MNKHSDESILSAFANVAEGKLTNISFSDADVVFVSKNYLAALHDTADKVNNLSETKIQIYHRISDAGSVVLDLVKLINNLNCGIKASYEFNDDGVEVTFKQDL